MKNVALRAVIQAVVKMTEGWHLRRNRQSLPRRGKFVGEALDRQVGRKFVFRVPQGLAIQETATGVYPIALDLVKGGLR